MYSYTEEWFSSGPSVFSTNKTDHHDIIELLLKVALNTIKQKCLPKTCVQSLPIPRDPPVIIATLPENRLVSAILTGPLQLLNKYQVIIIIINSLFQEGYTVNRKKLISTVALKYNI